MKNKKLKNKNIVQKDIASKLTPDDIMFLTAFGFDFDISKEHNSKEEIEAWAAGMSLNVLMNVLSNKSLSSKE